MVCLHSKCTYTLLKFNQFRLCWKTIKDGGIPDSANGDHVMSTVYVVKGLMYMTDYQVNMLLVD